MFQNKELELLHLQKKQLALRSDINRLRLMSDWEQVRSPRNWLGEGFGLIKRHPLMTAGIAAISGILATKALRRPKAVLGGFGTVGRVASAAFTAWKLFQRARHNGDARSREEEQPRRRT